ncbi:hypothetical protein F503_04202 [Ophiostoma piceae UAMH 11346]|uniref:Uncharacterized protein n=1 Tax=Ophiostoma piceae (strain UAMH 11346) TaxID=1262450 RepID=S3D5C4_OPHP1|nr:hypothetical protein F503_04202 [Ophiostoma piceae UAMH 11346]
MDTAVATPAALYSRLRTSWSPQMQAICDRYDESMRSHYEWLSQQVMQFQQDKAALLDMLQKEENSGPFLLSPQAFADAVVGAMMPASLQQLLALMMAGREPVEEGQQPEQCTPNVFQRRQDGRSVLPRMPTTSTFRVTAPLSCINPFLLAANRLGHQNAQTERKQLTGRENATPQRPPSGGKPDNGNQRTMASYFANKTVNPAKAHFSQLLRGQGDNTVKDRETTPEPEPKRPRLAPSSPPIYTWEVEATDYVFEYAPFGCGWFVLRCARGMDLPAVVFDSHPLCDRGRALGLAHFNDGTCKYHEHKTYTEEEMMVAYARRVVDEGDEDVTVHWAAESNEHICEMAERREKKKTRRQQRRKSGCARPRGRNVKTENVEPGKDGRGRLTSLMYGSTISNPVDVSDEDDFVVFGSEDDPTSSSCESSIGEY